jgi:hypothetical protein
MSTGTTPTTAIASATKPTTAATARSKQIGQYVQLGGLGAFVAGAILSMHHFAIGACFLAGAVAYYVGGKLRTS